MRTEGDRAGVLLRAYTRGAQLEGYLRERGRGDSEPPRTPRWRPWERAPAVLKVAEGGSSASVELRAAQMRCGSCSMASASQLLLTAPLHVVWPRCRHAAHRARLEAGRRPRVLSTCAHGALQEVQRGPVRQRSDVQSLRGLQPLETRHEAQLSTRQESHIALARRC